jgi:glycosyltransferase involved in cell wall biosynthesis
VVAESKLSVDPQDCQAIAQKMLDFNNLSSKKYQSLVSARQKYAQRFTWEKSAKKILSLIKKTVGESKNG